MAARRTAGQIPKVEILRNTDGKGHKCYICGDVLETKCHNLYMLGHSYTAIARMLGFELNRVKGHLIALGYVDKRKKSTLTVVRRILRGAKGNFKKPSDNLVAKALELQAKLTGELDEKPVTNIGIAIVTDSERKNRMKEGLGKFGVEIKDADE